MNSECNRARRVYRRVHRGERQCRKGLRVHRTKVELMRYPPLRHEKQPPSQGRRTTMNGKKKQQTRHSGGATSCAKSGPTPAILLPGRPGRKGGRGPSSCQESVKQNETWIVHPCPVSYCCGVQSYLDKSTRERSAPSALATSTQARAS